MNTEAEKAFNDGNKAMESESLQAALVLYKKAVNLCSTDPRYWISYGICLGKLNHWEEAAKALKTGVELKPHYGEADAKVFLAEALLKSGKTRDAIKELKFVVNMQPCYPGYEFPINEAKRMLNDCCG